MNSTLFSFITLASPLAFAITAIMSRLERGASPVWVKRMARLSGWISIAVFILGSMAAYRLGLLETPLFGAAGLGLSLRLDALSILMFGMIALIGFVVMRFSFNYLDGDNRQGIFLGRLAATIASVQLLVLAGNLGTLVLSWILTSMALHRLLVFYRERPGAVVAARKKFIVARLGDACLLAASISLYSLFGTGNLELIFEGLQENGQMGPRTEGVEAAAWLLAVAALLKSAQFPTHGWLVEVMETPTPVSALLHAGLLNAGPFLIIRMAQVLEASSYASFILILLGAFTALFASVVFLTQTSVKTALAYSSIAHMGFSLMTCGLGLYPAAMLHLVAHSFYKAHSFLASGSVIDGIWASKVMAAPRLGSPWRIGLGLILGLALFASVAFLWGDPLQNSPLLVIGGMIALGLARLFSSALDSREWRSLLGQASLMALLVMLAFFGLEWGMHHILAGELPSPGTPGTGEIILMGILLLIFSAAIFIQSLSPALPASSFTRAWAIHLRNGLYVNTIFDRLVRSLYSHGPGRNLQMIESLEQIKSSASRESPSRPVETV